ncbi:hypothetical protein GCM10022397_35910 [Flavivirga jejuensis]
MRVKPKRTVSWYLENGMLYLYLILVIFNIVTWGVSDINFFGFNKTVGWSFNYEDIFNFYYYGYSTFIYLFGFILLMILKKKTNKILGAIFMILVILPLLITNLIYLRLLTFLIFLILFFDALIKRANNRI